MPNLKGVNVNDAKVGIVGASELLGLAWLGWAQRREPWVGDAWYELLP